MLAWLSTTENRPSGPVVMVTVPLRPHWPGLALLSACSSLISGNLTVSRLRPHSGRQQESLPRGAAQRLSWLIRAKCLDGATPMRWRGNCGPEHECSRNIPGALGWGPGWVRAARVLSGTWGGRAWLEGPGCWVAGWPQGWGRSILPRHDGAGLGSAVPIHHL